MSPMSYDLPATFDGEVRLFPLPDLVMFPTNILPLHIFESRYREMLEDAVQGDGLITIATLLPGHESDYYSRPPLAPTVCVGKLSHHERNENGTYNLVLVGLRRARIEHEIEPVRSFRRAAVTLLEEPAIDRDKQSNVANELAARIATALPAAEKLVAELSDGRISLAAFTDVMAFHLPLSVDAKLKLLAEPDPVVRAKYLSKRVEAIETPRSNQSYPRDFSSN